MTQCERIIEHLKKNGSISSAEAMNEYGIFRLASRITELKKEHLIETKVEHGKNRFGEPIHYARYFLKDE